MGKFVISSRKNGAYHFNLKAGNGHVILSSESYKSKTACQNGIESVKKNAVNNARFEKITAPNGKFYFTLIASNGQVLGTSEIYESISGLEIGVDSVQTNAAESTVVEE